MNLKLVKASAEYCSQISEMMEEWNSYGEKIVPYAIRKNDYHDFQYYLDNLQITEEVDGKVPDTTLFCLITSRDKS